MEVLASGYGLVEGPRMDAAGGLYFSDAHGGGVYYRAPDGTLSTAVPKRKGVGGIAIHADGGIVVSGRNICHVKDGETRVVFDPPDTPGFNDLFTDAQGRVYVGTMRSNPFKPEGPRAMGELWRIGSDGQAEELYGDVSLTNGIGFSPDASKIYHSDTARNHVIGHDIAADGAVSNRRVFADLERGGPDGLAVDSEGFVWVADYLGGCVARFDPDGKLERRLDVPAKAVTTLCFGGSDGCDLIIGTADHSGDPSLKGCVLRTRSPVPGLPAPLARV
jgi:D-xylonolactonase